MEGRLARRQAELARLEQQVEELRAIGDQARRQAVDGRHAADEVSLPTLLQTGS